MNQINISYKSSKLILKTLKDKLTKKRSMLKKMMNDKKCSAEIYDKTVAECQDIEYAIHEVNKGAK